VFVLWLVHVQYALKAEVQKSQWGKGKNFPLFCRAVLCDITPSLFVGCMPGGWGVEISLHEHVMTVS
jgi:hypothetical protein